MRGMETKETKRPHRVGTCEGRHPRRGLCLALLAVTGNGNERNDPSPSPWKASPHATHRAALILVSVFDERSCLSVSRSQGSDSMSLPPANITGLCPLMNSSLGCTVRAATKQQFGRDSRTSSPNHLATRPFVGPSIHSDVFMVLDCACERCRVTPTRQGTFRPRSAMQESSIDTSRLMNAGSPLIVATWLQSPLTVDSPSSSARLRTEEKALRQLAECEPIAPGEERGCCAIGEVVMRPAVSWADRRIRQREGRTALLAPWSLPRWLGNIPQGSHHHGSASSRCAVAFDQWLAPARIECRKSRRLVLSVWRSFS